MGEEGWVYPTPLIEQGSLLLSAPSDHFAINQQYFHKTVIFIVEHTPQFTRGVILNRPTAFTTADLPDVDLPEELVNSSDRWNVWCGGDCQGLNSRRDALLIDRTVFYCLHTMEKLANVSAEMIIKGVYMIDLAVAQQLVAEGDADKEDFLLLVGYCGWAPGQLQDELDRGDTWTMAAADQRVLLGKLREAQANLTVRLEVAAQGGRGFTAKDVGDGLDDWEQLYEALGPEFSARLGERRRRAGEEAEVEEAEEAAPAGEGEEEAVDEASSDEHTDEMLRRWIGRCLIPPRIRAEPEFPSSPAALSGLGTQVNLTAGTILRGSATSWLLGKPAESPVLDAGFRRAPPGQYLHKSVLLLIRDYVSGTEPAYMVLVNGPKVGYVKNSPDSDSFNVYFGGPDGFGSSAGVFEMKGPTPYRFQGMILLVPGLLEQLVDMEALSVCSGVELDSVLSVPVENRWEAAGGRLETLEEASVARLGDMQRRKWYKRFLDLDLSEQ